MSMLGLYSYVLYTIQISMFKWTRYLLVENCEFADDN